MHNQTVSGKGISVMNTHGNMLKMAAVTAALIALPAWGYALQMTGTPMDVQQLTRSADEVLVGHVLEEETVAIGRRIETNYTIQVNENVKSRSRDMAPGQRFTLTLPGGSLESPPITQYVTGTPYLVEGEEVVLFLRRPDQRSATRAIDPSEEGGLRNTYRVVGYNQGRFSVLRDQESGDRMVTRVNLSDFGLANTSKDMKRVLKGIEEQKLPVIRQSLLPQTGSAAATRAKDPLEVTPVDETALTVEQRQQRAEATKRQRQRKAIPVEAFDSFMQQVRQHAADSQ